MISKWKYDARSRVTGLIGQLFVISLIISAPSLLDTILQFIKDPRVYLILLPIFLVIQFFLNAIFSLSNAYVYLNVARGEGAEISDAFYGFSNIGKALGLYFIMNLFIFLWSLLFIIPGIIKSYEYRFAFFVLVDNPEMSIFECLKTSKEITDGNKGQLFLLDLSYIGWYLLSIVTLGIHMIWIGPRIETSFACAYEELYFGYDDSEEEILDVEID